MGRNILGAKCLGKEVVWGRNNSEPIQMSNKGQPIVSPLAQGQDLVIAGIELESNASQLHHSAPFTNASTHRFKN